MVRKVPSNPTHLGNTSAPPYIQERGRGTAGLVVAAVREAAAATAPPDRSVSTKAMLLVRNLPPATTGTDLIMELFQDSNDILQANVGTDPAAGKLYAEVTFGHLQSANAMQQLHNNRVYKGCKLRVSVITWNIPAYVPSSVQAEAATTQRDFDASPERIEPDAEIGEYAQAKEIEIDQPHPTSHNVLPRARPSPKLNARKQLEVKTRSTPLELHTRSKNKNGPTIVRLGGKRAVPLVSNAPTRNTNIGQRVHREGTAVVKRKSAVSAGKELSTKRKRIADAGSIIVTKEFGEPPGRARDHMRNSRVGRAPLSKRTLLDPAKVTVTIHNRKESELMAMPTKDPNAPRGRRG